MFLGKPLIWNHKLGLSWHEILAGFVEKFDLNMNCFWFILTNEILWFMWRQRNEEIFQGRQRDLTGFFLKFTHLIISSQVMAVIEVIRERFLNLMRSNNMMLFKEDLIRDNFSSQGTTIQGRTNTEDRRILQEDTTDEANNENQQRIEHTYHHIMSEINSESNTLENVI